MKNPYGENAVLLKLPKKTMNRLKELAEQKKKDVPGYLQDCIQFIIDYKDGKTDLNTVKKEK